MNGVNATYIFGQSYSTFQRISYMDPSLSWLVRALIFHFFHRSSELTYFIYFIEAPVQSYWRCCFIGLSGADVFSHQFTRSLNAGVFIVKFLSLFETQSSQTRWLSISDRFRPLPRGLISRLSLRMFPGTTHWHWATMRTLTITFSRLHIIADISPIWHWVVSNLCRSIVERLSSYVFGARHYTRSVWHVDCTTTDS
jgi:hypothetical protein